MGMLDAHDYEAWRSRSENRRAIAASYERSRYWFYGRVTRVGAYGFQVETRPGVWLNWSKKAAHKIVERGKEYRITVDANGRVHAVQEVIESDGPDIPFDVEGSDGR